MKVLRILAIGATAAGASLATRLIADHLWPQKAPSKPQADKE